MAQYRPVSRWTRKRRNDNQFRKVIQELDNTDAPCFETEQDDANVVLDDLILSAADREAIEHHSDSDVDIYSESDFDNSLHPHCHTHSVSESHSDSSTDHCSLSDELADWALQYNVSHVAVTALLKILRKTHLDLPKDSRTIFGTESVASAVAVKNVAGGSYYHFGIEPGVISVLTKFGIDNSETVELHVNIDGLPLHRSTNAQFWPILGLIANCKYREPFVIGLFYGNVKPVDTAEYMNDFVTDCLALQTTGIRCNDKTYKIVLTAVICDTPARAFVKNTKGHAGYFGCDKCSQEGEYVAGRMTFPETAAELRTDHSFRALINEEHHTGQSPLTKLSVDMITAFPLDYMHLICLGVMRKLLYLWIKGPLHVRIGRQAVDRLSETLVYFREQAPLEFSRKPRSLAYLDRWKATELRQFLLYTGMVSLHGVLDDVLYNNFMLLSVAMYILLSPQLCLKYSDFASELLKTFVSNFGDIYGKQFLTYNVHATVHLASEAKIHGPLDNVSGFVFENHLGKLKKLIRKPHAPLQQIIRRLSERCLAVQCTALEVLQKEHCMGPVPSQFTICRQFREYHTHDCTVTLSHKDNCVLIGRDVALVRNFLLLEHDMFVVFQKFAHLTAFYTYPVDSVEFDVFRVADLDKHLHVAAVSAIRNKCVILSLAGNTFVIPFAH